MRVCIFGTGYVGLVTGTCLAEVGHDVLCIDVDAAKVEGLNRGVVPIFEPGLTPMVQANHAAGRLRFSVDAASGVAHGEVIFIAVGTPPDEDGSADLKYVLAVAASIGMHLDRPAVVVDKSTVPVGTADKVSARIASARPGAPTIRNAVCQPTARANDAPPPKPRAAPRGTARKKEAIVATLLWIIAVILVIAGIVMIIRGRLLAGIIAIIVGLLVGPDGVSIFNV